MPLVCSCRDVIEIWLLLKGGLSMLQDSGAKHPEWGKECLHVLPRAERMEGRRFPGRARRGVQPCGWKAQGAQERERELLSRSQVLPKSLQARGVCMGHCTGGDTSGSIFSESDAVRRRMWPAVAKCIVRAGIGNRMHSCSRNVGQY